MTQKVIGDVFRQGDIVLRRVKKLPTGLTPRKRDSRGRMVLAEGEVTGHAHAFYGTDVRGWDDGSGGIYLETLPTESGNPTIFKHHVEDHASIAMPPGLWRVENQQEYTPQEIRRVLD